MAVNQPLDESRTLYNYLLIFKDTEKYCLVLSPNSVNTRLFWEYHRCRSTIPPFHGGRTRSLSPQVIAARLVESSDVSRYEEFLGKGIPSKHSTFA